MYIYILLNGFWMFHFNNCILYFLEYISTLINRKWKREIKDLSVLCFAIAINNIYIKISLTNNDNVHLKCVFWCVSGWLVCLVINMSILYIFIIMLSFIHISVIGSMNFAGCAIFTNKKIQFFSFEMTSFLRTWFLWLAKLLLIIIIIITCDM